MAWGNALEHRFRCIPARPARHVPCNSRFSKLFRPPFHPRGGSGAGLRRSGGQFAVRTGQLALSDGLDSTAPGSALSGSGQGAARTQTRMPRATKKGLSSPRSVLP
jgi:hypothetical protein